MESIGSNVLPILAALWELAPPRCQWFVEQRIAQQVGLLLGTSAVRVNPAVKIRDLGLDAPSMLRLRQTIADEFALTLPAGQALMGLSIQDLGRLMLRHLGFDMVSGAPTPAPGTPCEPMPLPSRNDTLVSYPREQTHTREHRLTETPDTTAGELVRPPAVAEFIAHVCQRHARGVSIPV